MTPHRFVAICAFLFCLNSWADDFGCRPKRYLNEHLNTRHVVLKAGKTLALETSADTKLVELLRQTEYYSPRKSEWQSISQYVEQNCLTGLLVLKDGKVILEQYAFGRGPRDALTSASMSKTVTALATGLLIDSGELNAGQRVSDLLPDFVDSAFGNDTLEDLLRMNSAAKLVDGYSDMPDKTGDNTVLHPVTTPQTNARAYLSSKRERVVRPGERFFYSAADTAMLAIMVREVRKHPISDAFEQGIWRHIAVESGYWQVNRAGDIGVQCCFLATLRDWGRVGQLIAQRGKFNGQQLLSENFMRSFGTANPNKGQPTNGLGYGYQVWLPRFLPEGSREAVELRGTFGQILFADPTNNIVIAHTAAAATEQTPFPDWNALRNALLKVLTAAN